MNLDESQLARLGVPEPCLGLARSAVAAAADDARRRGSRRNLAKHLEKVLVTPEPYLDDKFFGGLAAELIRLQEPAAERQTPLNVWGRDGISTETFQAMEGFRTHPRTVATALMADAHGQLGMPVGGVLALEDAVCPGAVGVDIACRMKLSVLDIDPPRKALWDDEIFERSLLEGTCFDRDVLPGGRQNHPVMDNDWGITKITKRRKTKAWSQLGSSGGGNHFVEFGLLRVTQDHGILPVGEYLAILSHSGSRGTGAEVAKYYAERAVEQCGRRGESQLDSNTAYLDMRSAEGQEYWAAMNLMGEYAAANHDVIHGNLARMLGATAIAEVENHHNFAWAEKHFGRDLFVHRKGATPAGRGVLGIIPGSMSSPAHVVRGLGHPDSLASASHGAGRKLDRGQAKALFDLDTLHRDLTQQGVRLLQGGVDESPAVYKDISQVMMAQRDLVQSLATFHPRVVRMGGPRAGGSGQLAR